MWPADFPCPSARIQQDRLAYEILFDSFTAALWQAQRRSGLMIGVIGADSKEKRFYALQNAGRKLERKSPGCPAGALQWYSELSN